MYTSPAANNPYTQTHVVVAGDTLSKIAQKYYGDPSALHPDLRGQPGHPEGSEQDLSGSEAEDPVTVRYSVPTATEDVENEEAICLAAGRADGRAHRRLANQKGPAEQAIAGAEKGSPRCATPREVCARAARRRRCAAVRARRTRSSRVTTPALWPHARDDDRDRSLKDAATAKKADAEQALAKAKDDWGPASADVPKMVDAIPSASRCYPSRHSSPKRDQGGGRLRQERARLAEVDLGRRQRRLGFGRLHHRDGQGAGRQGQGRRHHEVAGDEPGE